MAQVRLDTKRIKDWDTFHLLCKEAFGFSDFYAMNMNAWIESLTNLREESGTSRIRLAEGEVLYVEISDANDFKARLPKIFNTLVESSSFVNMRNAAPVLLLVFH